MPAKPLYNFDGVEVYGNNHDIPFIYWWELTSKEKKEFDYLETESEQNQFTGFRYKGNVYSLSEFEKIHSYMPDWMKKFDGYHGDSFFSGILVKLSENSDFIKVYTYIS